VLTAAVAGALATRDAYRGPAVTPRPIERSCYAIGALLIVSGLIHLGVLPATGSSWDADLP